MTMEPKLLEDFNLQLKLNFTTISTLNFRFVSIDSLRPYHRKDRRRRPWRLHFLDRRCKPKRRDFQRATTHSIHKNEEKESERERERREHIHMNE